MREWCSCGAAFHSHSYKHVKEWRNTHRHECGSEPEPEKTGSMAQVERAPQLDYDQSSFTARIGFTPNA